jgi:GPH family glycoside/pentoside/hexuronide:cation symporter
MGWTLVAGLVGAVVMPFVRESTGTYTTGAAIIAGLMLVPAVLALLATRGRDVEQTRNASEAPLWTVLRVPAFRRVALLFLAAWSSISVLAALLPFYVREHLGDPRLEDAVMGTVQLSALAMIPLAMFAARRLEKHRAYTLLIGSWAVLLVGLAVLPEGAWGWGLVMCALMGPGVAGAHVLPWSMLPDVVEADQVANDGADRAGAFYGAMTFMEKAASAVALQAMLLGLQFAGYDRTLELQADTTQLAILLMIGPIPGVVLLLAAAFAWLRPPMTRSEHAAAVAALRSS